MPTVKRVKIPNGGISYVRAIDPVPESRSVEDGVTIINTAIPGKAARFDASFLVEIDLEEEGYEWTKFLALDVPVHRKDDGSSYRQIEALAARSLAPMLRAIADEIEREVAAYDERHSMDNQ